MCLPCLLIADISAQGIYLLIFLIPIFIKTGIANVLFLVRHGFSLGRLVYFHYFFIVDFWSDFLIDDILFD